MKTRTKVAVERETKKALLVVGGDGRKAWIQRRWLAADGTVAEETFEKAAASLAGRDQERADFAAWKNAFHPIGPVVRETEKAVAVEAVIACETTDQTARVLCWFPKSQLRDGQAPGWLILAKAEQARNERGFDRSPCVSVHGLPSPDGATQFIM